MTEEQKIRITEAKGRPMLHWVGKRPLDHVTAFPAQLVETYNPTDKQSEAQGLLFHGDSRDVLAWLLAHGYRGKVDLVYIDPPFDSGADYVRRVQLRGVKNATKLEGESYALREQIQYTDIWANDTYLQFMFERLLILNALLADHGSIYLHCDYRRNYHLRCLMDEVFGAKGIISEVIWHYSGAGVPGDRWASRHDTLLWYARQDHWTFNTDPVRTEYSPATIERFSHAIHNVRGDRDYGSQELHPLGKYPEDVLDISIEAPSATVRAGYPTQKPEALIERIIKASSNRGNLVLDCFVGSGTTAAVAQKLGRRWIAADLNKGAIQTTSRRLQRVIQEQIETGSQPEQKTLGASHRDESAAPVAFSFSVYRVNDYDLQVQHNEAVNLAVEHIGIDRTKTDTFFDGTLGRRLAKIVPFNHPLTPLDLQLIQDELKARPQEDRDIVVVCLGKELAADAWLEDYNRHRPINKIEVIELRTDQKYGKFFVHQPARAEVHVERKGGRIVVEIEDFLSPTIVERLEMDMPLFQAQITDWRAMVDCVMIDTSYDGEVFDITLSDAPERKDDLVQGRYELPAPEGETTVAVKIIDMLGEEVLVVREMQSTA